MRESIKSRKGGEHSSMEKTGVWKRISLCLKVAIGATAIVGVTLALIRARYDGYFHWTRRLAYFTTLSNLWIGLTCLAIVIVQTAISNRQRHLRRLYVLRYVFTVSIIVTGAVFCGLLAPFADASYHVWSLNSVLTHVVVPILSVVDFFVDGEGGCFSYRHLFYSLIPPLAYFVVAGAMGACGFDFGRGVNYPYFFMDLKSDVGLFGFSLNPPAMGTVYWILLFLAFMSGIAAALILLHPQSRRQRREKKENK